MPHTDRTNSWTLSKLRKETAKDFQKMIRMEAAVKARRDGLIQCVTCGRWKPWNRDMAGGHFLPGNNSIKFDIRNVHPQCNYHCNKMKSGARTEYTEFMLETYGQNTIDELYVLQSSGRTYTRKELLEMRSEFRQRCKTAQQNM